MNEDWRQAEIAGEVSAAARQLAHSTRAVPFPPDSYRILGDLGAATTSLAQAVQQLGRWHGNVEDGVDYFGEDASGDGHAALRASNELHKAQAALALAAKHIASAHTANAVVVWNTGQNSEH